MELVLTGAACRGAHAPLNRRSLPTRGANGPDFPLSGSSTRRRLLDDTTAIVACQKFGYFVTSSQHNDHARYGCRRSTNYEFLTATNTVLLTAPRKLTVIARSPLIDVSSGNFTINDDNQLKFANLAICSTMRS